jgi:hypothetical protein
VVWEKANIDLMLVTIDYKKVESSDLPVYADGVNVHVNLIPRTEFRKVVEGSFENSLVRALLATGRILYTNDETITALSQHMQKIGTHNNTTAASPCGDARCPPSTRRTSGSSRAATSTHTAPWILAPRPAWRRSRSCRASRGGS